MVLSCNEVSTCTTLIARLTSASAINSGAASITAVCNVLCPSMTIISGDIAFLVFPVSAKTLHQRTHQQVPAIDHDEQQYLDGRGDHHRWQLQHPDRGRDGSHHQINHQKGQKQN